MCLLEQGLALLADDEFVSHVRGISALAEPARRALYLYVVAQPDPVGRDQAATAAGVPRHTAKFHLDRLVEEGLLDTEYKRLSGRRGPGAGRPAKLYRRSTRQITITLPERHYDLAAQILAQAVEDAAHSGVPVLDSVQRAATNAGRRLGAQSRAVDQPEGSVAMQLLGDVLAARGYEPRTDGDTVVLANCPFRVLASQHTALVCGMNLHLIVAMLDELGHSDMTAELAPAAGRCCVTLTGTPEAPRRPSGAPE